VFAGLRTADNLPVSVTDGRDAVPHVAVYWLKCPVQLQEAQGDVSYLKSSLLLMQSSAHCCLTPDENVS